MAGKDPKELEWMTVASIASTYGVRYMTVTEWALKGCPHKKLPDLQLRFRLKDVIEWRRKSGL